MYTERKFYVRYHFIQKRQVYVDFRHRVKVYLVALQHNIYNISRTVVHLTFDCAIFGSQLTFTHRQLYPGRCEYRRTERELRYGNHVLSSCVSGTNDKASLLGAMVSQV